MTKRKQSSYDRRRTKRRTKRRARKGGRLVFSRPWHSIKKGFFRVSPRRSDKKKYKYNHNRKLRLKAPDLYIHQFDDSTTKEAARELQKEVEQLETKMREIRAFYGAEADRFAAANPGQRRGYGLTYRATAPYMKRLAEVKEILRALELSDEPVAGQPPKIPEPQDWVEG